MSNLSIPDSPKQENTPPTYTSNTPEEWGRVLGYTEGVLSVEKLMRETQYVLSRTIRGFDIAKIKERKNSMSKHIGTHEGGKNAGGIFINETLQALLRERFEQIFAHKMKNMPVEGEVKPRYITRTEALKISALKQSTKKMNQGEVQKFWSKMQGLHKDWFICTNPNSMPQSQEYLLRTQHLDDLIGELESFTHDTLRKRGFAYSETAGGHNSDFWGSAEELSLRIHTQSIGARVFK